MIKPIPTQTASAAPWFWTALACLFACGSLWAVFSWPAELVGVGEWVRQWVIDIL